MAKDELKTEICTSKVRASFVHVFEPFGKGNAKKKYQITLIIPKKQKDLLRKMEDCIDNAIDAGKSKLDGKRVRHLPLRDGDTDEGTRPEYENAYFLCAKSDTKPAILDENGEEILDKEEVYSGCYVKAIINFYAYNHEGSTGVAVGLAGVMKMDEGDKLSGRTVTAADFNSDDDDDV